MKTGAGLELGIRRRVGLLCVLRPEGFGGFGALKGKNAFSKPNPQTTNKPPRKQTAPNKQMPSAGRDGACHDSVTCAAAALCAAPKDGIVSDCGQPPCFAPRLVMTCKLA